MSNISKIRRTGSLFSALAIGATVATTIGAYIACRRHAPLWAFWLFTGVLLAQIPLGGVIGYLFRSPEYGQVEQGEE